MAFIKSSRLPFAHCNGHRAAKPLTVCTRAKCPSRYSRKRASTLPSERPTPQPAKSSESFSPKSAPSHPRARGIESRLDLGQIFRSKIAEKQTIIFRRTTLWPFPYRTRRLRDGCFSKPKISRTSASSSGPLGSWGDELFSSISRFRSSTNSGLR